MKFLRVYYTIEDLKVGAGPFKRDITDFPLKPGKYRLNKHPFFVFWILKYENGELSFGYKNNKYTLKDGCYAYIKLKKNKNYEYAVFFEMMDQKVESEIVEKEFKPILEEIPGAVLKVSYKSFERDTSSENTKEEKFELPVVLNANRRIPVLDNDMFIQRIVSEDEVIVHINGHWGDDIAVSSEKPGHFKASDAYGYNDNFHAFSIEMVIELVKK